MNVRKATVWLLGVCCAAIAAAQQVQRTAYLDLRPDGYGKVNASLEFDVPPPDGDALLERLGEVLGCKPEPAQATEAGYHARWALHTSCANAFRRRGLAIEGDVRLAPLVKVLKELHTGWLMVYVRHPHLGFSDSSDELSISTENAWFLEYYMQLKLDKPPPGLLHVAFGYHFSDVLRLLASLLGVLFVPVGLTLWMRGRALAAHPGNYAAVCFSYRRFQRWIAVAAWLIWFPAAFLLNTHMLVAFVATRFTHLSGIAGTVTIAVLASLAFVPPAAVQILCTVLSNEVFTKLAGTQWTTGDTLRQAVWGQASWLWPWVLFSFAMAGLTSGYYRAGVAVLLAAAALALFSRKRRLKAEGWNERPVTHGEFHDRVMALAETAGVKLQRICVMPAGKGRLANAFAAGTDQILISDYLLQQLSKREVDAVLAHELTHLKRGHPIWLTVVSLGATALPFVSWLVPGLKSLPTPVFWILILAGPTLLVNLFSRRIERTADAGGVRQTGDAEAFITAEAKLARLNLVPLEWGKWDRLWTTHPSSLRRIETAARRQGISPERVQLLLQTSEAEAEHYTLPAAEDRTGTVFSPQFREKIGIRLFWIMNVVEVFAPALIVLLVRWVGLEGAGAWLALGAGLSLVAGLAVLVDRWEPLMGFAELEWRLRDKLAREGLGAAVRDGILAGFAPDPEERHYEGCTFWDAGLLFLSNDRLCFVGERTRFALGREDVSRIEWTKEAPGWWPTKCAQIAWREERQQTGGEFRLSPVHARSPWRLTDGGSTMRAGLRAWVEGRVAARSLPPAAAELGPPQPVVAKSVAPSGRVSLMPLAEKGVVAALAAFFLGLSFGGDGSAWYVVLSALLCALFLSLPRVFAARAQCPAPRPGLTARET